MEKEEITIEEAVEFLEQILSKYGSPKLSRTEHCELEEELNSKFTPGQTEAVKFAIRELKEKLKKEN
jgi:hypothetical protein